MRSVDISGVLGLLDIDTVHSGQVGHGVLHLIALQTVHGLRCRPCVCHHEVEILHRGHLHLCHDIGGVTLVGVGHLIGISVVAVYAFLHVSGIEIAVVGTSESLCRSLVHVDIGIICCDGVDILGVCSLDGEEVVESQRSLPVEGEGCLPHLWHLEVLVNSDKVGHCSRLCWEELLLVVGQIGHHFLEHLLRGAHTSGEILQQRVGGIGYLH